MIELGKEIKDFIEFINEKKKQEHIG